MRSRVQPPGSAELRKAALCRRSVRMAALCIMVCVMGSGCVSVREEAAPPAPAVFYPPLPQQPRFQFLCSLSSADDVVVKRKLSALARFLLGEEEQEAAGQPIVRPYGMAMQDGKLYVCDSGARRGLILDFANRKFGTFGNPKGAYALGLPINVSLGPLGAKYVTDVGQGRVLVLDGDDKPVRTIGTADGFKPCDAVWRDQELFVADLKTNTIQVFDPTTGRLLRQFGELGSEPGQFFQPTNLAFGPEGYLYVSDTLNARVQKLDTQGNVVDVIGSRGAALGKMVRPKGIAVDRAGRLYVADAAPDSVQIYDSDGRYLLSLGGPGNDPGDLDLPAKVIISYEGIEHFAQYGAPDFEIEYLVLVSSQLGPNKISVYGFGTYLGPLPEESDAPAPQAAEGGDEEAE